MTALGQTTEGLATSQSSRIDESQCPDLTSPLYQKLCTVQSLGLAGFPDNYHTVSQLGIYNRRIIPVDNLGLHLTWKPGEESYIFIKPLPRDMVCIPSSTKQVSVSSSSTQSSPSIVADGADSCIAKFAYPTTSVTTATMGFLYSYTRLINSEVDLYLSVDQGLVDERFKLDDGLGWGRWQAFKSKIEEMRPQEKMDDRFQYGDLRLNRLFLRLPPLYVPTAFYNTHDQPALSFQTWYIKWLIIVLGVTSTILSAMQVAVAVDPGMTAANDVFKWFSLAFLLAVAANMALGLCYLFVQGMYQVQGWRKRVLKDDPPHELEHWVGRT